MEYKSRKESPELQKLHILNTRMELTEEEKQHYLNLKKGYEGEVRFDCFTRELQCDCLVVNDLLLHHNNTTFQVDSTIITSGPLFFYEVKNFEGDFYFESEKFYKRPKLEVLNPFNQLSRTSSLFPKLLQSQGFSMRTEGNVVFINPEFTLYQAPMDKPIIFTSQINHHVKHLNALTGKLTKKHYLLAEKLVELHKEESPFSLLPKYDYAGLKKGIPCECCHSFFVTLEGHNVVCLNCGHREKLKNAVIRHVNEIRVLFPDVKITTSLVHDWCGIVEDQRRITRILNDTFEKCGNTHGTYFI